MSKRYTFNFIYFNNSALSRGVALFVSLVLQEILIIILFLLTQCHPIFAQTGFSSLSANSGESDSLYREMLSSVEGAISITASVRQNIRLFSQEFNAYGTYNELKSTELRGKVPSRFRLDMKVQTTNDTRDDKSFNSLTIVCDNTYNNIYRYFSVEGEKRLERIEIKRVVEEIEKFGRNDIPTEVGSVFGLGGLAGMLREMRNRYDFNTVPLRTQIQEKNSAMSVWKIRGQLKPEIVANLTGDGSVKKQTIPKHTPTTIDIYIGVEDRFPYRFDYFWTADGAESTDEPFAYLVFYNLILHAGNIPESVFDYRPSENIPENDVTNQVIYQIMQAGSVTK